MSGKAQTPSGYPRNLLGNAPWWLISAGIHVVVLLTTTLLFIESQFSVDAPDVVLQVTPSRPKLVARDWRSWTSDDGVGVVREDRIAKGDEMVLRPGLGDDWVRPCAPNSIAVVGLAGTGRGIGRGHVHG